MWIQQNKGHTLWSQTSEHVGEEECGWGGFPILYLNITLRSQTSEHVGEEEGGWGGFPISYYPKVTDLWTCPGRRWWVRWPFWGAHCHVFRGHSFRELKTGVSNDNIWTSLGGVHFILLTWGVQSAQLPSLPLMTLTTFYSTKCAPNGICLCTKYPCPSLLIPLYTFSGWKLIPKHLKFLIFWPFSLLEFSVSTGQTCTSQRTTQAKGRA